jgi:molecular chaperone GrpE
MKLRRSHEAPLWGAHTLYFLMQVHEAIAREESSQFKAGIVSHEVRRGFLLKERLLRPATVKVSTGPGKQSASSVEAAKDAAVGI